MTTHNGETVTLRDKPITDQIRWLANCIYGNREYGPKIRPAMREIAILCAEGFVTEQSDKQQKLFLSQLKQYITDPTSRLKEKIRSTWRMQPKGLGDAGTVVIEDNDYTATMDTLVTVGIANEYSLDLTKVKTRMNSLLDELGL